MVRDSIPQKWLVCRDLHDWHLWLTMHHDKESSVWLQIKRVKSKEEGILLNEAVEEALCFGWIDGVMHSLDSEKYIIRMTPRRPGSMWSLINRNRAERLIAEGRMTEAGMAPILEAQANGNWQTAYSSRADSKHPVGRQLLRNPETQPSSEIIAKALGDSNKAYDKFINELRSRDIHLEWRYYNDGKAWLAKGLFKWTGVRGGQKDITVFWLSIWDGFFKVSIYVPEKARADVMNLPLADDVKRMIAASQQMGKLKYFPIVFELYTDELFEAVFLLVDFRKSTK